MSFFFSFHVIFVFINSWKNLKARTIPKKEAKLRGKIWFRITPNYGFTELYLSMVGLNKIYPTKKVYTLYPSMYNVNKSCRSMFKVSYWSFLQKNTQATVMLWFCWLWSFFYLFWLIKSIYLPKKQWFLLIPWFHSSFKDLD